MELGVFAIILNRIKKNLPIKYVTKQTLEFKFLRSEGLIEEVDGTTKLTSKAKEILQTV